MISNIIRNARTHVAARAEAFAEEHQNDSVIYTMGSGAALELPIWRVSVYLWRCSGLIQAVFIPVNFSMVHFEVTDANQVRL